MTLAHGAVGLALVLLVPWKQVIARRGLRRRGSGRTPVAGPRLAFLLVLSIGTGVLHLLGGFGTYLGLTPMQLHVGSALVAVPLVLQHVLTHRQGPRRADLSRRSVLRGAAHAAGGVAAWGAVKGPPRPPGRTRRASTGAASVA